MKYLIDLDDTLINSTTLNNDSYNFALEKFGYERIITDGRITRKSLGFINQEAILNNIILEKQNYFTQKWLLHRTLVNNQLINKIKQFGKDNVFIWTMAEKSRAIKTLKHHNLENYFTDIIYDKKISFENSIDCLSNSLNTNNVIIYENNLNFFINKPALIVDSIQNKNFNINGYLVNLRKKKD